MASVVSAFDSKLIRLESCTRFRVWPLPDPDDGFCSALCLVHSIVQPKNASAIVLFRYIRRRPRENADIRGNHDALRTYSCIAKM